MTQAVRDCHCRGESECGCPILKPPSFRAFEVTDVELQQTGRWSDRGVGRGGVRTPFSVEAAQVDSWAKVVNL